MVCVQDIKLKFSGLSYLIYCNKVANFYQILRLASLDMRRTLKKSLDQASL